MKLTEIYFKKPLLYDYLFSAIIIAIFAILDCMGKITIPTASKSENFSSDIGAIGLTVSGFVLTVIAILLTLRADQVLNEDELKNDSNAFKVFLNSPLYEKSVSILKKGVMSLILISMLMYIFRLGVSGLSEYLFYFNIVGLIIVLMTFVRCFWVLSMIMKMQKIEKKDELS